MGTRLLLTEGYTCKPIVLLLVLQPIGLWHCLIACVCRLCLSIGLWVFHRTGYVFDAQTSVEFG